MTKNTTLDNNLAGYYSGSDPFQAARAQTVTSESGVMDSPFPDIGTSSVQESLAPQPSMQDMQEPLKGLNFGDLAKRLGVDIQGLAEDRSVGSLQLMKRLQTRFSPSSPQFDLLMRAFMNEHEDKGMQSSVTRADRTLKALFGG